ncbi:MAG TPA: O-antigen ligase family protein [Anaerolineales bacterium]|nr:O-antigen ligase family protein [Anaerolineales bacterium]HRK88639.1 O-antigen ligase family protein [Anaerolineales bacterium]
MIKQTPLNINNIWYQFGSGFIAAGLGGLLGFLISEVENPIYIIGGVIGALVAFVTVLNADFGLLVLVFMIYTRFSDVMVRQGVPSTLQPYMALIALGIAARWIFTREVPRDVIKSLGYVMAYALVVLGSVFYASDFTIAIDSVVNFLKDGIITIIMVFLISNVNTFRKVMWSLMAAGIFLGTISVYQGVTGRYDTEFWGFGRSGFLNIVGYTEGNRATGPMGDPNYYAQLILVVIPIAMNRFATEKHWMLRGLAAWAVFVTTLTVVFTYSRGAVVALIIMGVFAMLHRPPRIADLVLGALLFSVLMTFLPSNYTERIATIFDVFGGTNNIREEVSFRGRASENIVALLMFRDRPILGVGVNNYPLYYQQYSRTLGLDPRAENRQAHNLFLQVAAESGLIGILVFGTILWVVLKGIQDSWRKLKDVGMDEHASMFLSFAVGFVGYLGAALFVHAAYPRYFWLLAGIGFAVPQITQKLLAVASGRRNEQ